PPRRVSVPVAREVTQRYADASGDHSPAHTDPAAAANAGFPDIILHGMCTVGLAVSALAPTARRVAVRFARPAHPGPPLGLGGGAPGGGGPGLDARRGGVRARTGGGREP